MKPTILNRISQVMFVATMLVAFSFSQSALARTLPDPTVLTEMPTEVGVSTNHVEMDGNAIDADGPTPGAKKDEDCDGVDPDATPYNPCEINFGEPGNYKGGEDWETLNTEANKNPGTYSGNAVVRDFVPDSPRINTVFPGVYVSDDDDQTVYSGQSCKDVEDLANCTNSAKGFPDKDDIENAYAAIFLNEVARPIWSGLEADGTPICTPYTDELGVVIDNPAHDEPGENPYWGQTPDYVQCQWHELGDVLLYMGLDLAVGNGSASLGAWLLDRPAPQPADGDKFGDPPYNFMREDGDLAIIANFESGGRAYELLTYRYRGPDCQALVDAEQGASAPDCEGPLEPLVRSGGEAGLCTTCFPQCNGISCAISNTGELKQGNTVVDEGVGTVAAPWPYVAAPSEGGATDRFPTTTFFEGFVNLTALYRQLGEELGCFTNFIYETRASHSIDARLHDWVGGELPLCGLDINKSGDNVAKADPADDVTYSFVLTNTGVVPLDLVWVGDYITGYTPTDYVNANTPPADNGTTILWHLGDLTGDVTTAAGTTCTGTLAASASCTFSKDRTMSASDPDPMENTTIAVYSYGTARVSAEESHSVDTFKAGVEIIKTGPSISKVGDQVTYNFTINNLSDGDLTTPAIIDGTSPALLIDSISDTVLGDLSSQATTANCNTLVHGGSCSFSVDYTVQATDSDPLLNTVTVHYHPDGFPNDIWDDDGHSLDIFTADVEIIKTGDTVSKAGDEVTYQFTINNLSDGDLSTGALDGTTPPLLIDSISDTVLGDLSSYATANGCNTLAQGGSCNFSVNYTVLGTDPDPLANTVTVHYHPDGFANDVTDDDNHSVDLFSPAVEIVKTGESISKAGDDVTYQFTITNLSDGDLTTGGQDGTSPALLIDSISDTVLGNLITPANAAGCSTLAQGASCNFSIVRTVLGSDPDPLDNTVTVHYHPDGFPNDVQDSDSHSVDLFAPDVQIVKSSVTTQTKPGHTVTYDFTITNLSDGDLSTGGQDGTSPALLIDSISDTVLGDLSSQATANGCNTLAQGASCSFSVDRTVLATDPDPLPNTVTVHYHPAGFPNDVWDDDSHSVDLFTADVEIIKTGGTLSKIGDSVTYDFTINNKSDGDLSTGALDGSAPNLVLVSIVDTVLGDLSSQATTAGCNSLAVGGSCNFSVNRTVLGTDPDPLPNTVTVHYNPVGFTNDVAHSDGHSVNLFQPDIDVSKTCQPEGGSIGEDVVIGNDAVFTITIGNTSSADTPTLNKYSINDSLLGDLSSQATSQGCDSLISGASCTISLNYTTTAAGTLANTVDVEYRPTGFPNPITDSASASCNVVPGDEGCTPGFWQGGFGATLWDTVSDPHWTASGGNGTNPYIHDTLFNDYFTPYQGLDGKTMLDLVGTGGGREPFQKAARNVVAAYLNASWGMNYPLSPAAIADMWTAAVVDSSDAAFQALHTTLGAYNQLGCPISGRVSLPMTR